jgi:hypothetical protein
MKIGIIGPPEVGKSKFAKALAKEHDLKIVDNYCQRLQRDTNLALGPWALYSEDFMIAGTRLAAEVKAPDNRIVVGTILDTLTYAAIRSDLTLNQGFPSDRTAYVSAQATMQALSLIYSETWDFHLAFHLPYSKEQKEKQRKGWQSALDDAYRLMLESYMPAFTYTIEGSLSEKINIALEVIEIAQTTPSSDETEAPAPK